MIKDQKKNDRRSRLDRYNPRRSLADSFPDKSDDWILEWLRKGLGE
jgi:hypothetical protein